MGIWRRRAAGARPSVSCPSIWCAIEGGPARSQHLRRHRDDARAQRRSCSNADAVVTLPGRPGEPRRVVRGPDLAPARAARQAGFPVERQGLLDAADGAAAFIVAQGFADPGFLDLVGSASTVPELMAALRESLSLTPDLQNKRVRGQISGRRSRPSWVKGSPKTSTATANYRVGLRCARAEAHRRSAAAGEKHQRNRGEQRTG